MAKFVLTSEKTKYNHIIKFNSNIPLYENTDETFEFNKTDACNNSLLAKDLFAFPFVKGIFFSPEYVAIECIDNIDLNDINEELKNHIEHFLNSGEPIIMPNTKENSFITVYLENTPNPETIKFTTNKLLFQEMYTYSSIEEAKNTPLGQILFKTKYIKTLFFSENYISITKLKELDWLDISEELKECCVTYLNSKEPIFLKKEHVKKNQHQDEISKKIINFLEEYVQPQVSMDGGSITYLKYDSPSKNVDLLFSGACRGCPSSTTTLKFGVEKLLKDYMPLEVKTVTAVEESQSGIIH